MMTQNSIVVILMTGGQDLLMMLMTIGEGHMMTLVTTYHYDTDDPCNDTEDP
jgi:hypothetical protein